MTSETAQLCDDGTLQLIIATAGGNAEGAVAMIDTALATWPADHRLHFLRGSLLVGLKRFVGAHQAMARAVSLAPDFTLARFQLGFFELTSGEPEAARATWQPLKLALTPGSWMLFFVQGLEHLINDCFAECIACLEEGIRLNDENLPLNTDMTLIIDKCRDLLGPDAVAESTEEPQISATSFLLGHRTRRH